MRIMRWVGRGLAVVVALAAVAIGGVYAQTQWAFSRPAPPPQRAALPVVQDSATLARGAKLATTNGCTECHTASLGGNLMIDAPVFGRIPASNLTKGVGGVLARYDDRALDAAIRDGVSWDGRRLVIMPSREYADLADDDVAAIIAFIRSRNPVDNTLPPRMLGPISRGLIAAGQLEVPYDEIDHARTTSKIAPPPGSLEQGRYVAVSCTGCHGRDFGGGAVPGQPSDALRAPDITPSGRMAQWSEAQFVAMFRNGRRPDGSELDASMPWRAFSSLSDAELHGVYLYLRTLSPAESRAN